MNTLTNPIDDYTEFMNDSSESRQGVMPVLITGYKDRTALRSSIVKTKRVSRDIYQSTLQHLVGFAYLTFGAMIAVGFSEMVVFTFNKF